MVSFKTVIPQVLGTNTCRHTNTSLSWHEGTWPNSQSNCPLTAMWPIGPPLFASAKLSECDHTLTQSYFIFLLRCHTTTILVLLFLLFLVFPLLTLRLIYSTCIDSSPVTSKSSTNDGRSLYLFTAHVPATYSTLCLIFLP